MFIKGFWEQLKKPILVLAPMADVTDAAFRRVIAKYGKPDVMWTEFVSADGLFLGGREHLMRDLMYTEAERPIVAQFFTSRPDLMYEAAKLAVELGFDGVDINMGCPDKSIEKQGAGAGMIKNPRKAREVLRAAIEGAQSGVRKIPVSVKTRIGYNKNELETWLPELLAEKPAAVIIHARTRKEMSKVPARWEHVKRAVEIRNELKSETLILGNGDVTDIEDARKKCEETGADGAMLGRAIFGTPWLFANMTHVKGGGHIEHPAGALAKEDIAKRLTIMVEHTKLFQELLGQHKNFSIMKKHFRAYVNGWPASPKGGDGAKDLRMKLMETENAEQVEAIVREYLR